MTHISEFTNGASLEDCHTNVFALADLNGIKWRRFCSDSIYINPLDDPILLSYCECLSSGVLAAWRRVFNQKQGSYMQEENSLSCCKELWIFWGGDDPDFSKLLKSNIYEAEFGSWESGLSYEGRTLFFKALHNSIERAYLSCGFAKFGRYFIQPKKFDGSSVSRKHNAIAFHFFIHGESTVCASIDTRSTSPIYILNKFHITAAQGGHQGIKVILSPYGLSGKLTGVGYKYSDPNMARFLNEWNYFFPHPWKSDQWKIDSEYPNVVEVCVAGARMKYPVSYVFVTEEDHFEAFPHHQPPASGTYALPPVQREMKSSHLYSGGLLTPPMSPDDPKANDSDHKNFQISSSFVSNDDSIHQVNIANCVTSIKQSVSQECCISVPSEKTDDNSALWDFQDPSVPTKCICSRVSRKSKKKHGLSSDVSSHYNHNHRNIKNEKLNVPRVGIPFHRQKSSCINQEYLRIASISSKEIINSSTNSIKLSNSNLPQLQTSVHQFKSESLPATPDAFYTPATSLDPAMPTLSPQPPVPLINEENGSNFLESSHSNISNSNLNSPQGVNLRGKISDEILSPFHASLLNMFENAKSVSKTSSVKYQYNYDEVPGCVPHQSSENDTSSVQPIVKPCLPKRQCEDTDGPQQTMAGLLYDYKHFSSPLWDPPAKRKCILNTQRHFQLYDKDSDIEDNVADNNKDMKKSVPSVPKDPYEFTEFDETAPSEKGFRPSTESFCKDEDKFLPFNLPSPVEPSPAISSQEITLSNLNDTSGKALSPPGTKNSCPKFITVEDLAVSLDDLENIFDTSSSEEDNVEANATSMQLPQYDEFAGKIELSRMYPTPPSLEQNAVPSPYGNISGPDCAIVENDALRENPESDKNYSILFEDEEVNVWIPPLLHVFPESPAYSPKELLSVYDNTSLNLIYKSNFQFNTRISCTPSFEDSSSFDKQQIDIMQPILVLGMDQNNSFHIHNNSQDAMVMFSACDSLSSPSISYASKSISSSNSNISQPTLEVHPLIVNLLLSDSMLNIFKDHNFHCCCLCVCNMNIKGSDAGIILPSMLIPSGNNEPQYKCTCGFSAVVHRHKSYKAGLFYEDELEVFGSDCDNLYRSSEVEDQQSKTMAFLSDPIPDFILDIIKIQCKTVNSNFSLFHKSKLLREKNSSSPLNILEFMDGCEVCFMALEEGKNAMDNPVPSKLDENLKSFCLHKWPYISSPLPTSQEMILHLDSLKPLLQVAIHKKNTQKLWDVTYVVSGPLTWKEFHRLAPRGTEDQCEPQPIPFLMTGHDGDCSILSPFSVRLWDKLNLEPYSPPRDVAYIVVAPENDMVLLHIKKFFKELSCCYESHNLGKHQPITKVLRDGIMRVGKTAASKVAEEPISDWFSSIGDGSIPNKLRLYARVCKHRLAPHLSTLPLDKSIFENSSNKSEKFSFSSVLSSCDTPEHPNIPRHLENGNGSDNHSSTFSSSSQDHADDSGQQSLSLVIYIVEPFTFAQCDPDLYRLVSLGLLHSYADMLSSLPETTKNAINLQLISLDSIMSSRGYSERRNNDIKALAFSVFSQSHNLFSYQSSVKSLTGFGPAATQDAFLNKNLNNMPSTLKVYNQPYILASLKDKQTELGEMFGDGRENSATLFCSYCLTEDKRYIIASCTNNKGEFIETIFINIAVPNRNKRKHTSVLKFGLCKLLEFIFEVMSVSVHPWRLIIERFGRLGQGELKTWACLLSRKSLNSFSKRLREKCEQCSISDVTDIPCILSVCLVSLEPDSTIKLMSDHFTPDDRFNCSRYKTCQLNTPEDASCTHILVFPTSATTQSSQVTLHQEHIDPLPGGLGEDFFDELNEDINNSDINDIFKWTENEQSPGNSPIQDNNSQPSSPNVFKSSFSQESTSQFATLISDCQEEPLQLLQQPLALGYYVSTAKIGSLPKWFWSSCPHLEHVSPVYLKSALLIHVPYVQKSSDDLLQTNLQQQLMCHPMDSMFTTDVLRYVLEGHNSLSWLALDSNYRDRRSCLPIHIQTLIQLYDIVEAIM